MKNAITEIEQVLAVTLLVYSAGDGSLIDDRNKIARLIPLNELTNPVTKKIVEFILAQNDITSEEIYFKLKEFNFDPDTLLAKKDEYFMWSLDRAYKKWRALLKETEIRHELVDILKERDYERVVTLLQKIVGQSPQTVLPAWPEIYADMKRPIDLQFGLPYTDSVTHGLKRGCVYVIGGWTSCGKTSLAVNAVNTCIEGKKKVLYMSFEMSKVEMVHRLIALRTGIAYSAIMANRLTPDKLVQVENEYYAIAPLPINIYAGTSKIDTITKEIINHQPDLIVIDYLQRIAGGTKNRVEELNGYMNLFKDLSLPGMIKPDGMAFIVLSQLSRPPDKEFGRPNLSYLRASGGIEENADVVMLLDWVWKTADHAKRIKLEAAGKQNIVYLAIEKNRQGEIRDVDLLFFPHSGKFGEVSKNGGGNE